MNQKKRYFERGHDKRWDTSGAVDNLGSLMGGIPATAYTERACAHPKIWTGDATAESLFEGQERLSDPAQCRFYFGVVTSLAAGEAARCSARLSCSTCWVQSAISSSRALISRARG